MDDPPAISPLPRRNANPRTPPLGQKGVRRAGKRLVHPGHRPTAATKTLAAFLLLCLAGCQTVNGKKYYVGPKIRFDLNVKGVGLGITLYDPLHPEDPRILDLPLHQPGSGKEPVQK